jgi:hypothetical protein
MSQQQYGYCLRCRADVPVTGDRRCQIDGTLCIPPSFGTHTQQWTPEGWVPAVERPEGYVYTPPTYLSGTAPDAVVPAACDRCRKPITRRTGGGSQRKFCSALCKTRAGHERRKDRKAGVAA